jgi:hypothetical protein
MITVMAIFQSHLFVAVLVLSAVAAAWVYVRWRLSLSDPWAFRRGVPKWTLGTLATVVLVTGIFTYRHDQLEARLSRAAGDLVGASVKVHCQSIGGEMVDASADLGFVRYDADGVPEHAALIKYDQCQDLKAYLSHHGRNPSAGQVVAVHVLTHESMHMRGETNEAAAECQAMQRDARTARDLGASPADAAALAATYWRVDYPRMPDAYRSSDCHPGGSMDEHLPDGWPGGQSPAAASVS